MLPETRRRTISSERKLLEAIKENNGFTFRDILDFSRKRGIGFGPQRSIFDVINEYTKSGFLKLNQKGDKIIYVGSEERRQLKGLNT